MLPLIPEHIFHLKQLEYIHRDPFDRMLLAQAETESLYFITADQTILKYEKSFLPNANILAD
ncbi:hypothetical protein ACWA5Z_00780 [Testudinibacter sp. P80/BLE/0925]